MHCKLEHEPVGMGASERFSEDVGMAPLSSISSVDRSDARRHAPPTYSSAHQVRVPKRVRASGPPPHDEGAAADGRRALADTSAKDAEEAVRSNGPAHGAPERGASADERRSAPAVRTDADAEVRSPHEPVAGGASAFGAPVRGGTGEHDRGEPKVAIPSSLVTYAKVTVLSLPLLLVAYIGYSYVQYVRYTATYTLDLNKAKFKDDSLPLYVDEPQSSPKFPFVAVDAHGSTTYAQVEGSPISLVFQPQEYIGGKTLTVSAGIKDMGDWEITLVCPDCTMDKDGRGKYDWQPFYVGTVANYHKAATFDGVAVYTASSTRADGSPFLPTSSVAEWLAKNYPGDPTDPPPLQMYDDVYPRRKLTNPNIDFHPGEKTTVTKVLRGPHEFLVYLDQVLKLDLVKTDINDYAGSDDITVNLYDLDDVLVATKHVADDGVVVANHNRNVVRASVSAAVPVPGVYRLEFLGPADEKVKNDWTITTFTVNTNKLLLSGPSLVLSPATFYTRVLDPTDLDVFVWHTYSTQTIDLVSLSDPASATTTLTIGAAQLNKHQTLPLAPGTYALTTAGDQVLNGPLLAFEPTQYFEPYLYRMVGSDAHAPVVLARDKADRTTAPGVGLATHTFTAGDLAPLADGKAVRIQMRNAGLGRSYADAAALYQGGYFFIATNGQQSLFENGTSSMPAAEGARLLQEISTTSPVEGMSVSLFPGADAQATTTASTTSATLPLWDVEHRTDLVVADRQYPFTPRLYSVEVRVQ